MKTSWNAQSAVLAGLAIVVISIVPARTTAQQQGTSGVVTIFDHDKLDASFAKSLASGGGSLLWSHASDKGTYNVQVHSRESVKAACKPEGCGHKDYMAVVYVVSGAATLVVGGVSKTPVRDEFGGQLVRGGESHRIVAGDVFIMPPDTIHWYKDVHAPFRYIEVPVP